MLVTMFLLSMLWVASFFCYVWENEYGVAIAGFLGVLGLVASAYGGWLTTGVETGLIAFFAIMALFNLVFVVALLFAAPWEHWRKPFDSTFGH